MLHHTDHSRLRSAQRGLSDDGIEYIFQYGSPFHCAGALIYYLRKQDVPVSDQRNNRVMQLVGTALVLSRDGRTIITTWRNRRTGLKIIKRKPVYTCEQW
jgi:hypothetical protein